MIMAEVLAGMIVFFMVIVAVVAIVNMIVRKGK